VTGSTQYDPEAERKRALRRVQTARRAIGLDDDTWRDLLERVTGQRSAAALGAGQLRDVSAELGRLGWTPEAHGGGGTWRPRAKHGHHRKIYAIWGGLRAAGVWKVQSVQSLHAFCKRVAWVDHVEWCDAHQASKVIEALRAIADRAGVALR